MNDVFPRYKSTLAPVMGQDYNELVRAVRRAMPQAGEGVTISRGEHGSTISLNQKERVATSTPKEREKLRPFACRQTSKGLVCYIPNDSILFTSEEVDGDFDPNSRFDFPSNHVYLCSYLRPPDGSPVFTYASDGNGVHFSQQDEDYERFSDWGDGASNETSLRSWWFPVVDAISDSWYIENDFDKDIYLYVYLGAFESDYPIYVKLSTQYYETQREAFHDTLVENTGYLNERYFRRIRIASFPLAVDATTEEKFIDYSNIHQYVCSSLLLHTAWSLRHSGSKGDSIKILKNDINTNKPIVTYIEENVVFDGEESGGEESGGEGGSAKKRTHKEIVLQAANFLDVNRIVINTGYTQSDGIVGDNGIVEAICCESLRSFLEGKTRLYQDVGVYDPEIGVDGVLNLTSKDIAETDEYGIIVKPDEDEHNDTGVAPYDHVHKDEDILIQDGGYMDHKMGGPIIIEENPYSSFKSYILAIGDIYKWRDEIDPPEFEYDEHGDVLHDELGRPLRMHKGPVLRKKELEEALKKYVDNESLMKLLAALEEGSTGEVQKHNHYLSDIKDLDVSWNGDTGSIFDGSVYHILAQNSTFYSRIAGIRHDRTFGADGTTVASEKNSISNFEFLHPNMVALVDPDTSAIIASSTVQVSSRDAVLTLDKWLYGGMSLGTYTSGETLFNLTSAFIAKQDDEGVNVNEPTKSPIMFGGLSTEVNVSVSPAIHKHRASDVIVNIPTLGDSDLSQAMNEVDDRLVEIEDTLATFEDEILLDDEGNPILDKDGNPVTKPGRFVPRDAFGELFSAEVKAKDVVTTDVMTVAIEKSVSEAVNGKFANAFHTHKITEIENFEESVVGVLDGALGDAAFMDLGTDADTVAAGNHTHKLEDLKISDCSSSCLVISENGNLRHSNHVFSDDMSDWEYLRALCALFTRDSSNDLSLDFSHLSGFTLEANKFIATTADGKLSTPQEQPLVGVNLESNKFTATNEDGKLITPQEQPITLEITPFEKDRIMVVQAGAEKPTLAEGLSVVSPSSTQNVPSGASFGGNFAPASDTVTFGEAGGKGSIIYLACRSISDNDTAYICYRPFTITSDGRIYAIGSESPSQTICAAG